MEFGIITWALDGYGMSGREEGVQYAEMMDSKSDDLTTPVTHDFYVTSGFQECWLICERLL